RRALGRIVFADRVKREKLNALVHPEARRAINAWLKMQSADCKEKRGRREIGATIAAALVPLAYEAGWETGWDAVICVAAPLPVQIARLVKKGFSEKEAGARIAAQMSLAEKMSKADYVIFNAGTLEGLHQQTRKVFRSIKEQTEKRYGRKK
ncbi:MAG: dephospho-CoA kinase, partial [Kiritimatiellia bacterium]|nr:dephospho-CoA kinase [Kiritimatiellia bacterium]